jgi:predicted dehydrogenase
MPPVTIAILSCYKIRAWTLSSSQRRPALIESLPQRPPKRESTSLLEKPMALALEDADAIIAAAETAGVSLLAMPFDQLRTLTETKRIIQEGRIGRPVSFQATALHNGTNHSPWFYRRGGGVLSDLAIYPISWITGLVGAAARVSAISSMVVPERTMLDGSVTSCEVEDNQPCPDPPME